MTIDLSTEVVPKSDQLNSDDLVAGSITIEITQVSKKESGEQRTSIHYKGDNGKPYKPGKSMISVMGEAWGWDGAAYVGRFLTLYRDPNVTFGKTWKGAIRISHMSHIDKPMDIWITATRGIKKPHHVDPIRLDQRQAAPATKEATPEQKEAAAKKKSDAIIAKIATAQNIGMVDEIMQSEDDALTRLKANYPDIADNLYAQVQFKIDSFNQQPTE